MTLSVLEKAYYIFNTNSMDVIASAGKLTHEEYAYLKKHRMLVAHLYDVLNQMEEKDWNVIREKLERVYQVNQITKGMALHEACRCAAKRVMEKARVSSSITGLEMLREVNSMLHSQGLGYYFRVVRTTQGDFTVCLEKEYIHL